MAQASARAMILAAGFGTRLGELTQHRPKPMLEVCGTPLVRWSARWLAHHGIEDVAVNLHHLGEQIEGNLGDGSDMGLSVRYSHEEGMILGTGGGLRHARALIDDGNETPIVLVNGKILVDLDLTALLELHRARGAEATMVLRADPNAQKWGSLQVDEQGRVVRLLGSASASGSAHGVPGEHLMFTGIHVISPRFLDRIPPEGEQCVIRTAYRELFNEGDGLYGMVSDDYWWEHSTPERYLNGVFNVLRGDVELAHAERPLRGVDPSATVAASAEIVGPVWVGRNAMIEEGATVGPYAQIGDGATVRAGTTVAGSVVWSGAEVSRDAIDTVVP